MKPGYLESWRRFRRVLKQRNAALRSGATAPTIAGWDAEFVEHAAAIDAGRQAAAEAAGPALAAAGRALLGSGVAADYERGWQAQTSLREVLARGLERDRQLGSTQHGPQRADLRLSFDSRRARKRVSRGQQKLLAAALILAATETAQAALGRPLLLLLDDPVAELDDAALQRLMDRVIDLGCQVVATSLTPDAPLFPRPPAVFHVEHGQLERRS